MIVDKIQKFLGENHSIDEYLGKTLFAKQAEHAFMRQFIERKERDGVGLSSCGQCPRKLAYKHLGITTEGRDIDMRAMFTFFIGDMVEAAVTQLAILAGCNILNTGGDQTEVEWEILGHVFKGHTDGVLVGEDGVRHNVEIKSMPSYSFARFEKGFIDDGYKAQINAYMYAGGTYDTVYVAYNKDAGVLKEKIFKIEPNVVGDAQRRLSAVVASSPDRLPEREFGPNEKGLLPWQCDYCSSNITCWPGAERVVEKNRNKLRIINDNQ